VSDEERKTRAVPRRPLIAPLATRYRACGCPGLRSQLPLLRKQRTAAGFITVRASSWRAQPFLEVAEWKPGNVRVIAASERV
jgi:hypothetical protein